MYIVIIIHVQCSLDILPTRPMWAIKRGWQYIKSTITDNSLSCQKKSGTLFFGYILYEHLDNIEFYSAIIRNKPDHKNILSSLSHFTAPLSKYRCVIAHGCKVFGILSRVNPIKFNHLFVKIDGIWHHAGLAL